VPVREPSGKVVGILVFHPKEDYFRDVLSGMHIGKGFVYMVDKHGHLVYHPNHQLDRVYDFSGIPAVDKVNKGLPGYEKSIDVVSKEVVFLTFHPMKWGWGIIMQRPEKEVLEPVRQVIFGIFLFAGISILIGAVIAYDGTELLYSIRSLSVKLREKEKVEREINEKLQVELGERKQAEQKLERTLVDLERSNKELEQFAYVASHDLQEPLRKVASFTELLERRYKEQLGPDADRYIGYIVDGAKRMSLLINDLLTFSRIGTSTKKFAKTDCSDVLRRTLENLQYRIRESGAVLTFDNLPSVIADELQIGMVFQNLISNAIKFHRDEIPRIHVSAKCEGSDWIFSVSDNGIGMEKEFLDRIFVMFQRLHTKDEYPGTGIGLSICKKVVERHGGHIWVESEFGKGSTFYFKLPKNKKEVNES
jgi:signal transduction histidine kinase